MKAVLLTMCGVLAISTLPSLHAETLTAPTIALSAVQQEVLTFEKQRCDAVLRKDVSALNVMLADDTTYVHASGIKQNKQEYLAYVAAGKVTFTSYQISGSVVHVLGDAAVTHGTFSYDIATAKPPVHGATLYTGVYVRANGKWKLTSWEASPKVE